MPYTSRSLERSVIFELICKDRPSLRESFLELAQGKEVGMPTFIHVAVDGSDLADGTETRPYPTIGRAAEVARPGDTVIVHEGEYREWVRPRRGGLSDERRISYVAAPGERVVIKGSEVVAGWARLAGTVWRASVNNEIFGDWNPFSQEIAGDWLVDPQPPVRKHLGAVYLNGASLYEVLDQNDVEQAPLRTEVVDHWTGLAEAVRSPEDTQRVWYAEVGNGSTTIWANFQGADPNVELVEINVRRSVFFPDRHHIDYITVRGFELAQAATPWAPPTADQPGLVGPNWAKGWIIEDNIIHDSKCSAVSLGKEATTGDNFHTLRGDKPGYQYQLESVFAARQLGWDREHVGSHVVRRNEIFDCGQNAIVGHLGCIFSRIEDNHIYNIATRREFYGHEIAGIKLHAAIDVEIVHNRIHDCSLGMWLDWQAQGSLVSRNICYSNRRDLFVEVSHGPYVVDHNLLMSPVALESFSQGGAYVNNLVGGTVRLETVMDRATPYHRPHSTQVAGYAVIYGGDDRYVGNIFLGGEIDGAYGGVERIRGWVGYGTAGYNAHPAQFEEYLERVSEQPGNDLQKFIDVKQPVYARNNVYASGAEAFAREDSAGVLDELASVRVVEEAEEVYLLASLPSSFDRAQLGVVTGADLPRVRFVDADFEGHGGEALVLDVDLVGDRKERGKVYAAGPLAQLTGGSTRTRLW